MHYTKLKICPRACIKITLYIHLHLYKRRWSTSRLGTAAVGSGTYCRAHDDDRFPTLAKRVYLYLIWFFSFFFFQSLSIWISVFPDLVNDRLGTYFKHDNVVQRDVSGGFNIATTFFLQATHLLVYRTNPVLRKGKRIADVSSLIFFNQSYLHLSVRIFRRSILARKPFSTITVKRRKRSRTTQMSEDHDGYFNELTDLFYTL